MQKPLFFVLLLISSFIANGQSYSAVDEGSKVKFIIKNFGINTGGTFQGLSGTIVFDPANLSVAEFNVSVDAKTVDTDISARDNHIRKEEYLDVEKFPKIIFKSTRITKTNMVEFLYVFGNLTIKDVTQEVKFPFTVTPKDGGYLFEGEFKINRRDFGVGGRSFSMADELKVELSVFAR
jgi:polyisoprenoid-binding protein YceI